MLNLSFIAGFFSIFWFMLSLRLVNVSSLLASKDTELWYQTIIIICLPIAILWCIIIVAKNTAEEKRNALLLEQLKKNIDTTATLGGAMLDICIEIKNNMDLQKINVLISDINETLSDIIKKSNSISSTQIEHLWNRTSSGEQWLLAKTFLETYDYQPGFANHLIQKSRKDNVLKERILNFCSHYLGLRNLLEKQDKQRLYYNVIENGALGSVFRLMAPIAETIQNQAPISSEPEKTPHKEFTLVDDSLSFPSFLTSEDKSDDTPHFSKQDIDQGLKNIRDELLSTENQEILPAPTITGFSNTQSIIRNIKQMPSISLPEKDEKLSRKIITLDELEKEINASPENNYDEYAYPFGEK